MEFIERLHSRDQHLCDKRKYLQEKGSTPTALVWDSDMAAVILFWDTNMGAVKLLWDTNMSVTSCENAPLPLYFNVMLLI